VVTVSHAGYIKRVPLSTYRAQRRGGRGRSGMQTREEDFVERLFVANTHTPVLFFTTLGRAFELKVWRLPEGTPQSRGRPMINLLPLTAGERIATLMPLPAEEEERNKLHIMFATSKGEVRRNALTDFLNIKANGKIAMKLEDEAGTSLGRLIAASTCREDQDVLLATRNGKCIRFPVTSVRQFTGRTSTGVRGISLTGEDEVISMSMLNGITASVQDRDDYLRIAAARRRQANANGNGNGNGEHEDGEDLGTSVEEALARFGQQRVEQMEAAEEFVLTISELGFGKRTSSYEYRTTNRGGQGIANMEITAKNGPVAAAFPVADSDQVMLVTDNGRLIRTPLRDVRIARRQTQGVTVLRVDQGERVVSVTRLAESDVDEDSAEAGGEGK
jgi:DNA gyrase subunit A